MFDCAGVPGTDGVDGACLTPNQVTLVVIATSLCCAMVTFGGLTQPKMVVSSAQLKSRHKEGTQGGQERFGDVRGCCDKAGQPLGAEHVRAILEAPARVQLG